MELTDNPASAAASQSALPQTNSGNDPGPSHFAFVDSLRGFAILGVMMVHASQQTQITSLPERVKSFGRMGQYGVQLFFVVSCFTLLWSLQNRMKRDRKPLHAFYVRRIFRIGPLFWLGTLIYVLFPLPGQEFWAPRGVGAGQVLATLTFLHGWYPSSINSVVPGGWSIAAEFTFYLFTPLMFRWIRSLEAAIWLSLGTAFFWNLISDVLLSHLATHFPGSWAVLLSEFVYYSFPSQFAVFCLGQVLYFLIIRRAGDTKVSATCLVCVAAFVILDDAQIHVRCAIGFVLLAYALAKQPLRLLVNPITRFIGTVSFSAYIWHFWVLAIIGPIVASLLAHITHSSKVIGLVQFIGIYLALVPITLVAASVSYYAVELPGQHLGKKIIQLLGWGSPKTTMKAS
jgi:peptidoglycan/LPS O-acetylase OafA/YrhL